MSFSKRNGLLPTRKQMQLDSIDSELKNRLWNCSKIYFLDNLFDSNTNFGHPYFLDFCKNLWHNYFKLPIDTIPHSNFDRIDFIRKEYFKSNWGQTYDFIEFIANSDVPGVISDLDEFKLECNKVLESEFSAYRFIDNIISRITNQNEISEIEDSIELSATFSSLKGVNIHLTTSLGKLSNKLNPDYRNSIKESISAVESMAKVISENSNDSLGGALDKIKGKLKIHQALVGGFKQLYGYTSDGDGIRHALMDEHNCDFEDAKYMLVSCSAFVNYLYTKANKIGIDFPCI